MQIIMGENAAHRTAYTFTKRKKERGEVLDKDVILFQKSLFCNPKIDINMKHVKVNVHTITDIIYVVVCIIMRPHKVMKCE